ncbi:DUF1462 family protein [Pontibacillus marinus]|uniref:Disulfide oxidoreductase n=1 Tax=Pontibacillus marinus BH030004 = DSM 16465 TaxID=1385511 RepID=A0A0A5I1R3_9BACI|nr:DUF1462 family protein [Pontibacillus marinus]KGX89797.1 disulfide oxidoreductase [Pontibacillus marinus BH030004 = DSM 16465]
MNKTTITVYGAEQRCASCVNAPGSKETYEWLEAAISRKYDSSDLQFQYIDIFTPPEQEEHQYFTQKILDDEYFYPLVVVNGEVVGEGNPRLKTVYRALESEGIQPTG